MVVVGYSADVIVLFGGYTADVFVLLGGTELMFWCCWVTVLMSLCNMLGVTVLMSVLLGLQC